MSNENLKRILVIAPYAFGYTAHIINALNEFNMVEANVLYLDQPTFKYRNSLHKIQNFISKIFGRNLKKTFVFDRIKHSVLQLEKQDIIFIIRPDLLNDTTIKFLKSKTQKFIAYFYDSTRRFSRKVEIIPFFDTIYSYDKIDVDIYGFTFLTNYIFEVSKNMNHDYLFFNISTNDYRFHLIETLAVYLKEKKWSYVIHVYNGSEMPSEHVEIITTQKSIKEVAKLIEASKIIVEIQRKEQVGLSFRVFESLGHNKKLITTNADVINYDFYNPQNILVIDENNIEISEDFVKSPYIEIPDTILDKYKIENWVKQVFNL